MVRIIQKHVGLKKYLLVVKLPDMNVVHFKDIVHLFQCGLDLFY